MNVIRKLWRGQYSLLISFWGFYVVGYIATYGLVILIAPLFGTQPWRALIVFLLIVPYSFLSAVGVFRSADAYALTRWWPVMAKIVVCLWSARLIWSFGKGAVVAVAEMGL